VCADSSPLLFPSLLDVRAPVLHSRRDSARFAPLPFFFLLSEPRSADRRCAREHKVVLPSFFFSLIQRDGSQAHAVLALFYVLFLCEVANLQSLSPLFFSRESSRKDSSRRFRPEIIPLFPRITAATPFPRTRLENSLAVNLFSQDFRGYSRAIVEALFRPSRVSTTAHLFFSLNSLRSSMGRRAGLL